MKKQVKKTLAYKGMIIKLYEVNRKELGSDKVRNIEAFDSIGKLLWAVEEPTSDRFYYDMKIDKGSDELRGDSGYGNVYTISLGDGHILESALIK